MSVTSWPRASSSTASALSRRQLPQYIPAAPAVMDRILIASDSELGEVLTRIDPRVDHERTRQRGHACEQPLERGRLVNPRTVASHAFGNLHEIRRIEPRAPARVLQSLL